MTSLYYNIVETDSPWPDVLLEVYYTEDNEAAVEITATGYDRESDSVSSVVEVVEFEAIETAIAFKDNYSKSNAEAYCRRREVYYDKSAFAEMCGPAKKVAPVVELQWISMASPPGSVILSAYGILGDSYSILHEEGSTSFYAEVYENCILDEKSHTTKKIEHEGSSLDGAKSICNKHFRERIKTKLHV